MITNFTNPMVSVVIPHFGGQNLISECLDSLKNSTYLNIEVVVVDNNSPDDSVIFIKNNYSEVKLIQSKYNRGFAGGCNFAIDFVKGDYILILNNDTVHDVNWITNLVKFMELNTSISSVQPKIKNYFKRDKFDYSGASGGFMDIYCFPFTRGRIFNTVEQDIGQYDDSHKIFWASGTAFLTRKKIFKELGGFDEVLFAHMEEIDYHWKCQLLGYEVWVEPKSVIYHKGASTLAVSSPKKTYLNYRNSLILLLSNYPLIISLLLLFPRLFLECIAFIKEILLFKWLHAFSIIKSWIWIFFHPRYIVHRRKIINKKTIPATISTFSIVFKYYIMGIKTYKNI